MTMILFSLLKYFVDGCSVSLLQVFLISYVKRCNDSLHGIIEVHVKRLKNDANLPINFIIISSWFRTAACLELQHHCPGGYSYRTEINDLLSQRITVMFELVCKQLSHCLVTLLGKLSRYDRDSIFSPFFTLVSISNFLLLRAK